MKRGPSARTTSARRMAYNVLHEVGAADAYANLELARALRAGKLSRRDAAFATDLVGTVLRNRMLLDAVLGECVDRQFEEVDPRLRDVLRIGACQALILDKSPHAVVSTSVDLARSVVGDGAARLVNAVLRRLTSRSACDWLGGVRELHVRWSHPPWIVAALRDALGPSGAAELEELLRVNNEPPPVTLTALPGLCQVGELVDVGGSAGKWSPYAVRAPRGSPGDIAAVREGRAIVQDEGSQLAAVALARVPVAGDDRLWLDGCAGPGGKAALLAALAGEAEASLIAADIRPHRARLVTAALRGFRSRAWTVVGDALHPPVQQADRVLVDAPCTGLGVLRRRPDLRWRRRPQDVAPLARLQTEMLRSAIEIARAGGMVAYVTCSPHIAESDLVVEQCLRDGNAELVDARPFLPSMRDVGRGPTVRLWPHRHDTDGMYLALMRRR